MLQDEQLYVILGAFICLVCPLFDFSSTGFFLRKLPGCKVGLLNRATCKNEVMPPFENKFDIRLVYSCNLLLMHIYVYLIVSTEFLCTYYFQ